MRGQGKSRGKKRKIRRGEDRRRQKGREVEERTNEETR